MCHFLHGEYSTHSNVLPHNRAAPVGGGGSGFANLWKNGGTKKTEKEGDKTKLSLSSPTRTYEAIVSTHTVTTMSIQLHQSYLLDNPHPLGRTPGALSSPLAAAAAAAELLFFFFRTFSFHKLILSRVMRRVNFFTVVPLGLPSALT